MPDETLHGGPHRLPRTVEPVHYELALSPDLEAATFAGEEHVRVRVLEEVTELVVNAADLAILTADLAHDHDGTRLSGTVTRDEAEERAHIRLARPAQPGPWTLHLTFTGTLNDKLRGFYRSTYRGSDGAERVIAATQFEATDARRAFPCWDEPDRKATFEVTLVVDAGHTALSNTAVAEDRDLGDGKHAVTFAPTMRMSTYLVAFIVGRLETTDPVDVDGVALRVAHVPGKAHLTGFALEIGAHALRFFADWFGIPYPGDKLDHVAIPDFAFGAMENLGCVTYRESLLLIDPAAATRAELERVAEVVAHETAHMWFGNLVTMRWWNGIWLNEAFATFMEVLCVDAFRPEWERWVAFGLSRESAMATDGLATTRPIEFPVRRPEEAEAMFDVLTYQKGAAVLRMLERYLGADRFRRGIRHYLTSHQHGNAETTDLWDAIEAVTGEPVRATMDSWIFQGGHPIVSVFGGDGAALRFEQRRFRYSPAADAAGSPWQVPLLVRAQREGASSGSSGPVGRDGRYESLRWLLTDEAGTLEPPVRAASAVVNAGGWGFYRVRYSDELLEPVTAAFERLEPLERCNLVADTWASVLAGLTPAAAFLGLVRRLGNEDDPNVWELALDDLLLVDRVIPETDRPHLQRFVQRLARPVLARVGWQRNEGEPERAGVLRAVLVEALGTFGADPDVRATAVELHAGLLQGEPVGDPNLLTALVRVVAEVGGEASYQTYLDRFRHPANPQEEVRYLYALADFPEPDIVARTLELALTEVRTQNAPFVIRSALTNRTSRANRELAWEFVKQRWGEIEHRLPTNTIRRMLDGVTALCTPEMAADARAFLESHPVHSGQQIVAQILERLDVRVAFAVREGAGLGAALVEACPG